MGMGGSFVVGSTSHVSPVTDSSGSAEKLLQRFSKATVGAVRGAVNSAWRADTARPVLSVVSTVEEVQPDAAALGTGRSGEYQRLLGHRPPTPPKP